ncbi:MAG TPA: RIO1 family regulatory kinase/ATPase [Longimicrobium sp.]|nr:RIO1 family regulatory kinase/ATPase [Longimicrobium sp.]
MSEALDTLLADGVIDEIVGRLKSGKEADVYLVGHGGQVVAAKVYKERQQRSFRNNADYKEGRQVRNSRTARAIAKGSRFGQAAAEDAWKSAEADALYKLHAAGVRVPTPVMFYEGVLLMELVVDPEGQPAPRLIEAMLSPDEASAMYQDLRNQTTRMLCSDVIHGDLSPYNILLGWNGPTIIDFPQTLNAAASSRAEFFFKRDMENLYRFFGGMDERVLARAGDAHEIWRAYVKRELTPDFEPSGRGGPPAERRHAGPREHRGPPREHRGPPAHRAEPVPAPVAAPEEDEFAILRQGGGERPRIADLARQQQGGGRSRGGPRQGRGGHAPRGAPQGPPREHRGPKPQGARPQEAGHGAGARPQGGGHKPEGARSHSGGHKPEGARPQGGGHKPEGARSHGGGHRNEARPQGTAQPHGGQRQESRPQGKGHGGQQQESRPQGKGHDGQRQESRPQGNGHGGQRQESRPHGNGRGGQRQESRPHGGPRAEHGGGQAERVQGPNPGAGRGPRNGRGNAGPVVTYVSKAGSGAESGSPAVQVQVDEGAKDAGRSGEANAPHHRRHGHRR